MDTVRPRRPRRRLAAAVAAVVVPAVVAVPFVAAAMTDRAPAPAAAGVTWEQLVAARVDLPPWPSGTPCASRGVGLAEPERPGGRGVNRLVAADFGDVDRDGGADALAVVQCLVDGRGHGPMQAVAFGRDPAGRIVARGRIVATRPDRTQWLLGIAAEPDGSVQVELVEPAARAWHTYRWDGGAFRETR